MSVVRPMLNAWLRLTEKPHLQSAKDAQALRRSFELKARMFFHAPFGTTRKNDNLGGRPTLHVSARGAPSDRIILYFHGGAYVFGSPRTHAAMLAWLCKDAKAHAFLPDYRKAPEHPFPSALEDAQAAWAALLERGHDPSDIIIGGDSAGGGLCLSLLAHLLEKGEACPAGVFAFSPLADLTFSGESIARNAHADVVLPASRVHELGAVYLDGADPRDPGASPLFADFTGAPPVWLTVGDTEILCDDTLRLDEKIQSVGGTTDVRITHDLPHVWPLFHNILPEARVTLLELGNWIRRQTTRSSES